MNDFENNFTLQLFHLTDQEANTTSVELASNLSAVKSVLEAQDIDGDGTEGYANTISLSSGDVWLPGLFYNASDEIYGVEGAADILIQNELGMDAVSFGNHEFDQGPGIIRQLLSADIDFDDEENPADFAPYAGPDFPYLSGNLDFSADEDLAPLVTDDHQEASSIAGQIAATAVVTTEGGEQIGLVGATTPELDDGLTSPGDDILVLPEGVAEPETEAELDALAAVIQEDVDALLAANPGLNKVVLMSHMQDITVEQALATRLEGVDIIIGGGSNSVFLDENDAGFGGESGFTTYPEEYTGADGNPVLLVNTDKNYEYLGRLVVDFDENGVVIPESYDPDLSGAFATDEEGLARIGATEDDVDPEIDAITDDVEATILEGESEFFAVTEVFINSGERFSRPGERIDGVRSQETNGANIVALSHLDAARDADPTTQIAYVNGGGIRTNIGTITAPGGGGEPERLPPEGVPGAKPEGGISANSVADTVSFNNDLEIVTITGAQFLEIVENNVAGFDAVTAEADGWGHYAGFDFSFDPSLPEGDRVVSAALVDEETGEVQQVLVRDGEVLPGVEEQEFRVVTLNFLNGIGDPVLSELSDEEKQTLNLTTDDQEYIGGTDTFNDGGQQDALAEWLLDTYGNQPGDPTFDEADTEVQQDTNIQNLRWRPDTVVDNEQLDGVVNVVFQGESDPEDEDSPEGASEVVAHEDGRLYVTNGNLDRVDVFDIAAGELAGTIDLSTLDNFDGVQSVAVSGGIVAVAVQDEVIDGVSQDGQVAFYDAGTLELIESVAVGNLPDQAVFSPDGGTLAVMNEGEFNFEIEAEDGITNDAPGSVSLISVDRSGDTPSFAETRISVADFAPTLIDAGVRVDENLDPNNQFEPEYASFSPDGSVLYVALQENNAAVAIDVAAGEIVAGVDFGTVDHSQPGNELDFQDDTEIEIVNAPLLGMRQPDSHVTFEIGGTTYLATANEGDGRGDATEVDGGDEARVGDILAGDVPGVAIDPSVDTDGLDRMIVSTVDGDTDGDGDIDELHSFGGRGFTIFDTETFEPVFDSGSDFELIVADLAAERFLNDDGETVGALDDDGDVIDQNRADAKGVEPEAIEFGVVRDTPYLFIGAERDSGVFIYDISTPSEAEFVDYIDGFAAGNVAPEIIEFIPREESTSGNEQIAVSYEVSGTTVVFDLAESETNETVQSYYAVALGRDEDSAGFDFWTTVRDRGNFTDEELADFYVQSPEFAENTAGATTEETVETLISNAGLEADAGLRDELVAVAADEGLDAVIVELVEDSFAFA